MGRPADSASDVVVWPLKVAVSKIKSAASARRAKWTARGTWFHTNNREGWMPRAASSFFTPGIAVAASCEWNTAASTDDGTARSTFAQRDKSEGVHFVKMETIAKVKGLGKEEAEEERERRRRWWWWSEWWGWGEGNWKATPSPAKDANE
jgi:hypothetical protein